MCQYGGNQRQLCDENRCRECYVKSLVSDNRHLFWDQNLNGELTPRQVFKDSMREYYFTCPRCFHSFKSTIRNFRCNHQGRK